jgi:hypothetical protein
VVSPSPASVKTVTIIAGAIVNHRRFVMSPDVAPGFRQTKALKHFHGAVNAGIFINVLNICARNEGVTQ